MHLFLNFRAFCMLIALSIAYGFVVKMAPTVSRRHLALKMGLGDILKKAMANEDLPPPKNPGLSKEPDYVTVEFLPSKKSVKAVKGQSLSQVAKSAGVDIKYKCKKGDCRTCEVVFQGNLVRACQSNIPVSTKECKFQVVVK